MQMKSLRVRSPEHEQPRRLAKLKSVAGLELGALVEVIEASVIPKISQVHGSANIALQSKGVSSVDVDDLVWAVLDLNERSPKDILKQQLDSGVSVEEICLGLLSPTAVRLGHKWLSDDLSFYQVTTGVARLQAILH
ncbi:MAG: B12-binding domain-containing protein, partial [Anderseniella sp.]